MAKRIVIKVGTSTLTAGTRQLHPPTMLELVRQIAALQRAGQSLLLVTSGAVAAGRARLANPALSKSVPMRQMLSAVGQPRLMALYDQLFGFYDCPVAQVLLTRHDLSRRSGYLNARNTLEGLLTQRIIPVINENDTVSTDEIRIGDNDNLAALVANVASADLLVLLTDQAGIFTADPRKDPTAKLVEQIEGAAIPPEIWEAAGGGSALGTGGMTTKLQAAQLAARSGVATIIAQGTAANVLPRIAAGERIGTHFAPLARPIDSLKRFILSGWDGKSRITVDAGAADALRNGKSLLAVGVRAVQGDFDAGETVSIDTLDGVALARGLSNYTARDTQKIIGKHSDEIENVLGYSAGSEIVHRDYLVMVAGM